MGGPVSGRAALRRFVAPLVALMLGAVTAGGVFALNYEGEDYCRDYPAWPNGTYLGQMHPHHSNFYAGYAERRGWDPCVTWALDQRGSAVRGLRELGFQVVEPSGGAPALTPTPTPDPAPAPPSAPKLTGPATTTWVYETFVNNQVTGADEPSGRRPSSRKGNWLLAVRTTKSRCSSGLDRERICHGQFGRFSADRLEVRRRSCLIRRVV